MNWRVATANALCSAPIAGAIRMLQPRTLKVGGLSFCTDNAAITDRTRASMFWGLYERAELRMISKHVDGQPAAIELGSSIGVTGAHILQRLAPSGRLVAVEPNPILLPTLQKNLRHHAAGRSVDVKSAAIDYSGRLSTYLSIGRETTGSKVSTQGTEVPATDLGSILDSYGITSGYVLMSDVEGMEMPLIQKDTEALMRCSVAIIETHSGVWQEKRFSPRDVRTELIARGFEILDHDGNVVVAQPAT